MDSRADREPGTGGHHGADGSPAGNEGAAGDGPGAFDRIPDEFVDSEWNLVKRMQLGETLIRSRYKELIGVAVAAVIRCPYATQLHTEVARLHGASVAELAEAVRYAALVATRSVQLNGLALDPDRFASEVSETVQHLVGRMGLEPDTLEHTQGGRPGPHEDRKRAPRPTK